MIKSRQREDLKALIDNTLPLSPAQFANQLIQERWGKDIDPQSTLLVNLNYDYHGHPAIDGMEQGRVQSTQSLTQVVLSNYQTVGDGRFGETAFGLYTPPVIGPCVRIVDNVDEFAYVGNGNHTNYEGIYRQTLPQTYGPQTQLQITPAEFKDWVWRLELKDKYSAYVDKAWPNDASITAAQSCPLRTSVKTAFVMAAYLQRQENSLTQDGLELALQAAGLPVDQGWARLTLDQLQAPTRRLHELEVSRLVIYRYTSDDLWVFRHSSQSRVLLYVPGNASPLHEFADTQALRHWIVQQAADASCKQALAAHFAEDDRVDGTFHAGVLTALDGMRLYPRQHHLQKGHGFFNDDGYWDPADYIHLETVPASTDPFAQLVLSMKQAAIASVQTIRDDAQVNRDDLSAVVEPVVQWINRYAPLALFVPGGEGLLALAGIIDAGYGLDQAVNGHDPDDRSAGLTRTVFGLLNALPVLGATAALRGEGVAEVVSERSVEPVQASKAPEIHPETPEVQPTTAPSVATRLELLRGIGAPVASLDDEALQQIAHISTVDDDMLRLMQAGRRPPTPQLADTLERFRIDRELAGMDVGLARSQAFNARYAALQHSDSRWVKLFQKQYPGLPKNAIEQVLERSGVDLHAPPSMLESRRLMRQLDGKLSEYQQHVRLQRAYEGLYLQSLDNPQTQTLALHSLTRLPGWPRALSIEVLDGSASGRVLDRVGAVESTDCRRLIKVGDGFLGPGAGQAANNFYQAVHDLLTAPERAALELDPLRAVEDLQLKIREHRLPRAQLISGLQRMDSGLTFEAMGLRGGGYPATASGAGLSRDVELFRVRWIYPGLSFQQAADFLEALGGGAMAELERLEARLNQLDADFNQWVTGTVLELEDFDVPLLRVGDEDAQGMDVAQIDDENLERVEEALHYEREARKGLVIELMGFWQHIGQARSRIMAGEQLLGYKLDMDFEHFVSLPALSGRFDNVLELSMKGFQITRPETLWDFLECFPNLRTLNLEGVDLRGVNARGVLEGSLPRAIWQMPNLTELNLKSTGLVLSEQTAGRLSGLVHLRTLDLSDNPLAVPPLVSGMNELRRLNLHNTGISHCPVGISEQPSMELLDLSDNRIGRFPPAVLAQAVARDRVQLWGNPLTDEDSLRRIVSHREQTGLNLWLSTADASVTQPAAWLQRLPQADSELKQMIWQRLLAKPRGARFLRLFEPLTRTADYRVSYPLIQARLWHVLGEADASNELWGVLSSDVALSALDAENPFASFTRLEHRVRLYKDWLRMGRPFEIEELQGQ
ncbi:dermonecrotic toxin domain-containing protein [Pseudomonas sp. R37(2017)]|uniref:dermonecrotic toxin domain-containing protein n=1 Tax=Pseudomonas sp. R37(2017) TaxID=1981685 RepID=UPI000A1F03F6|nr:DUF6543 domain-containing protein [Pseudomonas sp. R37(2017)]